MFDYSLLTGFFIAAFIINISPGPEMIFVITSTINDGKRHGLLAALGAATGSTVHVLMVAFGLAVILSTSLIVFTIIKIVGAIYLGYLGIKAIILKSETIVTNTKVVSTEKYYQKGILVGILNPKSVIFFLAFLPQFVNPNIGSYSFQIISLGLFTVLAGVLVELLVILLVNRIAEVISKKQKIMMLIDKVMGCVLVFFGLRLAFSTQND